MSDLIAPHGGLTEPVCCTVAADAADDFLASAADLPKVPVSAADLSTVYRIGDGTLSPLTGPMNSEVFNRVLDESVGASLKSAIECSDDDIVAAVIIAISKADCP